MNKKIVGTVIGLGVILAIAAGQSVIEKKQANQVPTVGVMQFMAHPALNQIYQGIRIGLEDNGYRIGRDVKIDFQNAQGDQSNLKTMASRFESEHTAVAVGIATPAAVAIANTIHDRPVVFSASTNPVSAKLVKNYARPGKNVTGVSDQAPLEQQLKMMRTLLPQMQTIGVIYTSSDDSATTEATKFQHLAQQAGLTVKMYSIASSNDLNQTSLQMVAGHNVDAVFVPTDNTIAGAMSTLIKNTDAAKVPVFPTVDTMVKQGGVASESINQKAIGIATGKMVAKILDGAEPATTPVDFMKTGDLIINRAQAEKLGITIPDTLDQRAHYIESIGK
ncbi:ABC transporter substrate-binding protein [Weissella diestrammenae]|uniref:ABC transporter substrate-binding protein n=1 Tax=Weissella diestrammenae TaxID=1162633 RepID=A0A7G9T474_9LACO|nr:tryptophan ABC transporter substrate-binding protein [Weissella diestrammenae]MCM0583425.1 ABC transporter substrate-binding protein [Weissella diestrammenae]QNN74899.1 ABC transporter substrate-binding protein [Weissella diestrammenae]